MGLGSGLERRESLSASAPGTIRATVVASDLLVGRRLAHVLEEDGITTTLAEELMNLQVADDTDVVVLLDEGRALGKCGPANAAAPVIVVSSRPGRGAVDDALAAGATGFVAAGDVTVRLAPTARAVAAGQLTVPAELREPPVPVLSPREKQVLAVVVMGFSNLEVAERLHVTEATVKSHLSSAYRKLGVRSRQEATARILSTKGLGLGILSLSPES